MLRVAQSLEWEPSGRAPGGGPHKTAPIPMKPPAEATGEPAPLVQDWGSLIIPGWKRETSFVGNACEGAFQRTPLFLSV